MKKDFVNPEIDVVRFEIEDVVPFPAADAVMIATVTSTAISNNLTAEW